MSFYYDIENTDRESLREAVCLAKVRYDETLSQFVKGSRDRLAYVAGEITRLCNEVAEMTSVDAPDIERMLRKLIAETVVSEPEKQNVEDRKETENTTEVPLEAGQTRTDIKDQEAVLEESKKKSRTATRKVGRDISTLLEFAKAYNDLGWAVQEQLWDILDNPDADLNPNAVSMIEESLLPWLVDFSPEEAELLQFHIDSWRSRQEEEFEEGDEDRIRDARCARCGEKLNPVVAEVTPVCDPCTSKLLGESPPLAKTAIGPLQPIAPTEEEPQDNLPPAARIDEPTQNTQNPVDIFDDTVMEMANLSAAILYSTPTDREIEEIADQKGLSPEQIRQHLQMVAEFGEITAVNGEIVEETPDLVGEGLTLLSELSGRIDRHEAEVSMDDALGQTQQKTNLDETSLYDAIKESYGDDLSGTYYLSIAGNVEVYLPGELVAPSTSVSPMGGEVDPEESQSMPAFSSLREFLDWDRREAARQLSARIR